MKKTIIAIASIVMSASLSPANANPDPGCDEIARIASAVMTARQSGESMGKVLNAAMGSDMLRQMVIRAYEIPRHRVPEYQIVAIEEFRDNWHLACIRVEDRRGGY